MLDMILDTVISGLREAGLDARREFPGGQANLRAGAQVAVGVESCRFLSPGLGEYLGLLEKADGSKVELFGKRLELDLRLEVFSAYSDTAGAQACMGAVSALRPALERLPAGLKLLSLSWDRVRADERFRVFRCPCVLRCLAFLVAESTGEEPEFLNFALKGRPVDGDK